MSKIKHITVTTTEQEIALGATYQFAWFRNNSDVDVIVSDHSGIVEDADDTEIIKSNDVGRITITNKDKVYAKSVSDTAKIDVHAQNFAECPFNSGAKGGGSGSDTNIYRTTTALTDGATTNPITVDGNDVTAVSGDFAVYNTQEFLFDGTQWNLLGDRVGLGDLAYKDTASGTAVTTVGTLPSLTYDSLTESFTFSAGTLPTTGTVTVS